ncbi:hypothetical protein KUCAC02_000318 [Chaenocephalus aceratus]|uniref:Uncharacterized protein n=1 Tax=Chaenocephalus aceratus TaxID=36190 RepID=A0ACB9W588_CHAAC|nr:hypothetical protein KUCAC02_000318 [Chaenocephalus aceratus]
MIGREKGAVSRMKEDNPELISYHCIIHQSVLCSSRSDEHAEIYTTSIEIATLLRKRRRLRSDSKRIGRRNARSLALFDPRAAEDDERYHAIRTAMICEYYGARRIPRSLGEQ